MIEEGKQLIALINYDSHKSKLLNNSKNFLIKNKSSIANFSYIYDLVNSAENGNKIAKGIEFHLTNVRNILIQTLWGHEIFIGASVIENLIFDIFKDNSVSDPIIQIADTLFQIKDLGEGIAIFPLHSVRFPVTPFAKSSQIISLNLDDIGVRVYPQANSFEKAIKNVKDTINAFGLSNIIPDNLFTHWSKARPLNWFSQNPILIVKLHNFPGSYYENQRVLVETLHFSTSIIYGFSALSTEEKDTFNTRLINNHETLDFNHYIVLYPVNKSDPLSGDCIPMSKEDAALIEPSDLNVFLSEHTESTLNKDLFDKFVSAIAENRKFYFSHSKYGSANLKKKSHAKLARKLSSSLRSFRRSHLSTNYTEEHIINLASAFEVLLTDNYSRGVGFTLKTRSAAALKMAGFTDYLNRSEQVANLYDLRCSVSHSGSLPEVSPIDFKLLREIFIVAYTQIGLRISTIKPNTNTPISDILMLTPEISHLKICLNNILLFFRKILFTIKKIFLSIFK